MDLRSALAYPLLFAGIMPTTGPPARPALYFVNAPVDFTLIGSCSS